MSSSVDEIGGSACGATEGQNSSGGGENVELYADVSEPLRGDLFYIEAALSYYDGGPASADVRSAWDRITSRLSSEEQRQSPSEASAGNAGLDERACGSCAWFDVNRGAEFGTCRESPAQVYVDHNGYTRWEQPRMHAKSWCSRFALELTAEKEGEGDE